MPKIKQRHLDLFAEAILKLLDDPYPPAPICQRCPASFLDEGPYFEIRDRHSHNYRNPYDEIMTAQGKCIVCLTLMDVPMSGDYPCPCIWFGKEEAPTIARLKLEEKGYLDDE